MIEWTDIQRQRLLELGVEEDRLDHKFIDHSDRNRAYQQLESELVNREKISLDMYRREIRRPALNLLENKLVEALTESGFSQVTTPILLAKGLLAKMKINEEHPLFEQVFWVDQRKCLRPMLAPNLYYVLKDLLRLWPHPVSIFEIGPCFRKDTQGSNHMQEFTMLNLVEMGLPVERCKDRLAEMAELVMDAAEITDYAFETENSEVYGDTVDLTAQGLELGSAAMGPHTLDEAWGITVPWVGIGFGLERLVMVREKHRNIQKAGRSLTYLNGVRLNI